MKYSGYKVRSVSPKKVNPKHLSRCCAMQAIYQWQFTHLPIDDVIMQFLTEHDLGKANKNYFKTLAEGVVNNIAEIDALLTPKLDRDMAELNPVELAVLRIAVYEFQHHIDVPFKVVINEALEVAKEYGAIDGFKFINGVLDALAPELRSVEAQQKS